MLFNSFEFFLFFPCVVLVHFLIPHRFRWLLLLAASYYFYMAWEPVYILLIVVSTLVDYFIGLLLGRTQIKPKRVLLLCVSVFVNLGLLFFFKYYNFLSTSFEDLFRLLSLPLSLPKTNVLLPIGISFYTFQTLGYTIDVYRGRQEPQKHLGIFALYVAFFPQLVAGPIERAKNLIPQLIQKHEFDYDRVTSGLKLMAWGLFKKIVIADRLASLVDTVYSDPTGFEGPVLFTATIFFAFQIYCDFSGYSDMAIGAAQVLGIKLMINFKRPYFAASIIEFWRRWHISLSTWFRDYLYISLGGSRAGLYRLLISIFVVFFLSGLWHGAKWTYVIWGVYHALLYLLSYVLIKRYPALLGSEKSTLLSNIVKILFTFSLVCIGWIIFRADSMQDVAYIITHLISGWTGYADILTIKSKIGISVFQMLICWSSIAFLLVIQIIQRKGSIRERVSKLPFIVRWSLYYALILSILLLGVFSENHFIYFQF